MVEDRIHRIQKGGPGAMAEDRLTPARIQVVRPWRSDNSSQPTVKPCDARGTALGNGNRS